MKTFKLKLLTATAGSLFTATGAHAAPLVYPAVDIQGNGASSIIVVLNKTQQCLGVDTPIGFGADGTTQAFPTHLYSPVTPSGSNPVYDCASRTIQPNLTYHYISTGSGNGKSNWSRFNTATLGPNSTAGINPFGTWDHIQYAFSDSAISATNLSDYNSTTAATSPAQAGAGAPIQVPFYVLPVAVAYSPVYGKRDTAGGVVDLALNVKSTFVTKDGAGNPTGGLHMKKTTYCAIMNGVITNFNNAALKTDNGGQSLMDPNDDLARWNGIGVPIKLVGRNDKSGTTNVFTRHLDAACGAGQIKTGLGGTDQLPVAAQGSARYDKQTGALTLGSETLGKFGLVDGSDGVAATVGQALATPGAGGTSLGGYIGYVGADFVRPATVGTGSPALFSASLQSGTSTSFKGPTAKDASAAFGGSYLPPESSSTGTYNPAVIANGSRSDPTAWVLPANATTKLANPTAGYPIVGTTNILLYTCYSTTAKRLGVHALAALQFGKILKDSVNLAVPAALATSTVAGSDLQLLGILPRNGLANLPSAWKTAIYETFFSKVTTGNNPSTLNLWIQDKLPTSQAQIDGNLGNGELQSNSTCTIGTGA